MKRNQTLNAIVVGLLGFFSTVTPHFVWAQSKITNQIVFTQDQMFLEALEPWIESIVANDALALSSSVKAITKRNIKIPLFAGSLEFRNAVSLTMVSSSQHPLEYLVYVVSKEDGMWRYPHLPVAYVNRARYHQQHSQGLLSRVKNITRLNHLAKNLDRSLLEQGIPFMDDRDQNIKQAQNQSIAMMASQDEHLKRYAKTIFEFWQKPTATLIEKKITDVRLYKALARKHMESTIWGWMKIYEAHRDYQSPITWQKHFAGFPAIKTIVQKYIDQSEKENTPDPKKPWKKTEPQLNWLQQVSEINQAISDINKVCDSQHNAYQLAFENNQLNQNSASNSDNQKLETYFQVGKTKELKRIKRETFELIKAPLEKLQSGLGISVYVTTKTLRDKMGTFDKHACYEEGLQLQKVEMQDIDRALIEMQKGVFAQLQKDINILLGKEIDETNETKQIKTWIQSAPILIGKVLLERGRKEENKKIFDIMAELSNEKRIDGYVDITMMGLGLATGITVGILTGTSSITVPASMAIMGAVDAAFVARGVWQWYEGYFIETQVRDGAVAGLSELNEAHEILNQMVEQQHMGKNTILWTVSGNAGSYVVGYGLGSFYKYIKSQKRFVKVQATPEMLASKPKNTVIELPSTNNITPKPQQPQKIAAGGITHFETSYLIEFNTGTTQDGKVIKVFTHSFENYQIRPTEYIERIESS